MLKLWHEVTLGAYPSTEAVRAALQNAGIRLSTWPEELIERVPLAIEPRQVRLAIVRPTILFPGRHVRLATIYNEVCERLGGVLCPPEVGLICHLQVATSDHSLYVVAMEPMMASDKSLVIFSVEHGIGSSGRWLRGLDGNQGHPWNRHDDPSLDQMIFLIKDD